MHDRIIETATSLFVERGFSGVPMREISEACGITKAALYYHFTSKAQLLYAVCQDYLDGNAAVVEAAVLEGGTYEEQLRRLVRGLFAVPSERRAILRLAMHDLDRLDDNDEEAFFDAFRERFTEPVKRIFTQGAASGEFRSFDPTLLVWFMVGMAYPYFGLPESTSVATGPETVDKLLSVFMDGLKLPAV
ncbi:MAG: TetR/AcrR family transcriptional regulator [Propionibacteriaceae bacterium]